MSIGSAPINRQLFGTKHSTPKPRPATGRVKATLAPGRHKAPLIAVKYVPIATTLSMPVCMRNNTGFSSPTDISNKDSGAIGIINVPNIGMAKRLAGKPNVPTC
jgi:hypothetical protein